MTALESGVNEGYGGKGVFYVFSAGNRHRYGQDIGFHEGKNFYAQTTVCAVDADGKRVSYSQTGYALWICAPEVKATTDNWNRYMDSFGGTSSATSIVSGSAALIRSANTGLTWRDVKVILAESATKNNPTNAGWETGASTYSSDSGRYHYNPEYGFGVVDASAAVALASNWTNLPPMVKTTSKVEVTWPQNRIRTRRRAPNRHHLPTDSPSVPTVRGSQHRSPPRGVQGPGDHPRFPVRYRVDTDRSTRRKSL